MTEGVSRSSSPATFHTAPCDGHAAWSPPLAQPRRRLCRRREAHRQAAERGRWPPRGWNSSRHVDGGETRRRPAGLAPRCRIARSHNGAYFVCLPPEGEIPAIRSRQGLSRRPASISAIRLMTTPPASSPLAAPFRRLWRQLAGFAFIRLEWYAGAHCRRHGRVNFYQAPMLKSLCDD